MSLGFSFVTKIRWLSPFSSRVRIEVLDVKSIWIVVQLPCSSRLLFSQGIRYFCRCIYMNIRVHLKSVYKPNRSSCCFFCLSDSCLEKYIYSMAIVYLGTQVQGNAITEIRTDFGSFGYLFPQPIFLGDNRFPLNRRFFLAKNENFFSVIFQKKVAHNRKRPRIPQESK